LTTAKHDTACPGFATLGRRYGDHIIRTGADLAALPAAMGLAPLSTGSLGLDHLQRSCFCLSTSVVGH
jgi:hypothetical protein